MKKKLDGPYMSSLALVLTFLAFVVPLPYYIEVPGGAEDIRQVLKVNETEDTEAGAYQFVTVGIRHATLSHLVYAWLTPFTDIRSAKGDCRVALLMQSLCGSINSTCKLLKTWPSIKD